MSQRLLTSGLLLALLLGAFAARVWRLDAESIWHDEGWSIRALRSPFGTPDDNTPPVYYTFMHLLWRGGIGETPFALRYGSALLGLLTTALAIRLSVEWAGRLAGFTGGALVASSPLLWEYAQEVRAYVAAPLVALAMVWAADRLLRYSSGERIPRQLWATTFGLMLIGLYTHNLVVPLAAWLNVALGAVWLWRREWRRLRTWLGLQIALLILYLPWLATQSPSGTPLNTPPEVGWRLARDIWRAYFLPILPQLKAADNAAWIDLAGGLAIVLALNLLILQRTARTWLLISHAVLVPAFSVALILRAHIDFHPRYFIAAVPVTLVMLAMGMAALRQVGGARLASAGFALLVAGGLWLAQDSLRAIADTRIYQHDDFEALAQVYAALPAEAVILIPYGREPALQDYYAEKFNIRARFVNVRLHASADAAIREINRLLISGEARPVEFLTWFQLPADQRGMYPCLLAAASEQVEDARRFYGLETRHYRLASPVELLPLTPQPRYQELSLRAAGWQASGPTVCIQTEWHLLQDTSQDFKVAVEIVNPLGEPIARSDAPLERRDQVGTAQWDGDDSGSAFSLLQLPPGAPPQDYAVRLTVYSDPQPEGLDVLSAEGAPIGKTFDLAQEIPLVGAPYPGPPARTTVISDSANGSGIADSSRSLDITLLLANLDANPSNTVEIELRGEGWTLAQTVYYAGSPVLAWLRFDFPPDVKSGAASLWVGETVVARYTIQAVSRVFTPPTVATPIEAQFPGVGNLIGVTMEQTIVSPADPPQVTLVWEATATPHTAYTVFVQLLDPNGRLLAQSDSQPAAGQRPTTSWAAGEYIEDNHSLTFRVDHYEGAAVLIVGFYDATTFERVLIDNGQDHAQLPLEVQVEQ